MSPHYQRCCLYDNLLCSSRSFKPDWTLAKRQVIEEDTILTLDPDTGDVINSKGKNMFYMPHGLTLDGEGNIYVTDTGLHQVMRVGSHLDHGRYRRGNWTAYHCCTHISMIFDQLVHRKEG